MATEVQQVSPTDADRGNKDSADQSSSQDHGRRDLRKSGRNSGPNIIKVGAHQARTTPGFDARRRNRPHETRETRDGKVRSLENRSEISQELRDQFTESLRSDMLQLIDLRKNYGNDADFKTMLNESGHSYYVALFDRVVQKQAGVDNRSYDINDKALRDFMSVDQGVITAYRIKMRKLQEQALAVAMVMSISPDEPVNDIPGRTTGKGSEVPTGDGHGPFRRGGRKAKEWLGRERTKNGRPKTSIYIDKNWKLVVNVAGANVVGAGAGALIGVSVGPPGALMGAALGAVGTEALLGAIKASKKGEYEKIELSGKALQTILGDKDSPTPAKRVPDRAQIEWLKKFYNVDPEQYRVNRDGEIERLNIVGDTGMDIKNDLMDKLRGEAKLIQDFQADDTIRPELRRPMGISWIFEQPANAERPNTPANRPRHNTPDEKAIMDEFKADFGGIQDMDGNHVARMDLVRDKQTIVPQETVAVDRLANYDVNALFHFDANTPLPRGTRIPFYTDPVTGAPAGNREARAGETVPVAIDIQSRPFNVGEALPMGTIIPAHRNSNNRYVPERRVTTMIETADHQFISPRRLIEDGETIPANTVLERHQAPVFDAEGKQQKIKAENIPPFRWDNLDVVGNAERWMAAEEKVLKRYVHEVFQSLVDGKTDHIMNARERLNRAREGHASGKMVDEEKKKLTRESDSLQKDSETLTAESGAIDTFQTKVAEKRKDLSKLRREADAIIRGIRINGAVEKNLNVVLQELQASLDEGNTTEITIGGHKFKSIEDDFNAIDRAINGQVRSYMTTHVRPKINAANQARTALRNPGTQAEINARLRTLQQAEEEERQARTDAAAHEKTLRETGRFKKRRERIEARQELVEKAIEKITGSTNALSNARDELTSNETEGREDAMLALKGMDISHERVAITWNITGANTDRDLATKSYDDLVKLINEAYANDPTKTKGWPESANNSAENRVTLLHAMAEARARLAEQQVRTPNPFIQRAAQADVNLAELDLYALTAEEIYDALPASLRTTNKASDLVDIGRMKEAVTKRLLARQKALNDTILSVDERKVKTDEKLTSVIEKGISVPEVDAIERAMDRYPDIWEQFMEHMPQQADRDTKIFAYAERTTGTPPVTASSVDENEAYENIMDLVFKHKEDYNVKFKNFPAGPQAAFERNKTVLSKQELTDAIYKHFGLRMANATLQRVLERIRTEDPVRLADFFGNTLVLEHFVNKIP